MSSILRYTGISNYSTPLLVNILPIFRELRWFFNFPFSRKLVLNTSFVLVLLRTVRMNGNNPGFLIEVFLH